MLDRVRFQDAGNPVKVGKRQQNPTKADPRPRISCGADLTEEWAYLDWAAKLHMQEQGNESQG
jgi:hypothetical protein